MSNQRPTIGILYPGEMGSSLGRLLVDDGCRVVTTLEGRSERTRRACRAAGLEVLAGVPEVATVAEVVVSLVPPDSAWEVCRRYCLGLPPGGARRLYVDANSIAPQTARKIERELDHWGVAMVDASISGLATRLRAHGKVYISGPETAAVEALLGRVVKVICLGDAIGTASTFKMLLAGMAKGLSALFLEVALAARQADLLDEFLQAYREGYPGVMALIDRHLPTYPRHARRRGQEMGELEATLHSLGLRPGVVQEVRRLTMGLGESASLAALAAGDAPPTVAELLEQLYLENFLHDGKAISCAAGVESTFEAR